MNFVKTTNVNTNTFNLKSLISIFVLFGNFGSNICQSLSIPRRCSASSELLPVGASSGHRQAMNRHTNSFCKLPLHAAWDFEIAR
jgi:hypothetical protein